ncbi:hypothetical protein ACEZCY_16410 [Streptacidiphilus sp. N1-12]|uniref:Integrase n=2 Tax=Streptacidiphilus alkalitolerans TaxID=3342712 RepID=A0ABV6WFP8_9ACTN
MVTRVEHDPLRIEFTFPDGSSWTGRLAGSVNPRLTEDLALGVVQLIHPLGPWTTKGTAVVYLSQLRRMVALLAEAGFHGGVGDLRPAHMLPFWLAASGERVASTRRLLEGCGEHVHSSLRAHLAGNAVKKRPRSEPLEPYTEDQWQVIESGLRTVVRQHLSVQRELLALAELGPDPSDRGLNRQNYAWLFSQRGPLKVADTAAALGVSTAPFTYGGSRLLFEVREGLFPPVRLAAAAKALFGVYSGVVPDGISDLGLGDVTWAGDKSVLLDYVKRRRGPESVNLPARAVRLLEAWLELSTPLRRMAPAQVAEDLWLFSTSHRGMPPHRDGPEVIAISSFAAGNKAGGRKARRSLAVEIGLTDHEGQPVPLHSARIRTTYHNRLARRGWTGRTRIDPNHTREVEGSHYVSTTTPAQADAVDSVIEDAQAEIVRRSRPPLVLTDAQAADFAAQYPGEVARLGLDDESLAALLGSEMDVFTAACANQYAGEHGPAGKPCPARPWVCLLCPLAVFLPRHAPNLLRLKAYFARQSRQMTVSQFIAVFGPFADRLTHDVLPRFDAAVLTQAAADVQDVDAELPLRPEEVTV